VSNHFSKISTFQGRFVQGNWTLPPYHKAESLISLVKWGTALRLPRLFENQRKSQPDIENAFFKLGVIIPEAPHQSKSCILGMCYIWFLLPSMLIFRQIFHIFRNYSPGTKISTLKLGPIRPWIYLIIYSPRIICLYLDWRSMCVCRTVFDLKFYKITTRNFITEK
jgi:hypothetical protein